EIKNQDTVMRSNSRPRWRRPLFVTGTLACLAGAAWSYDALGYQRAVQFEVENAGDPVAVLHAWQGDQFWHPTRYLFGSSLTERQRVHAIQEQARKYELHAQIAALRTQAADPHTDPEIAWQRLRELSATYTEPEAARELEPLRAALKARRDDGR